MDLFHLHHRNLKKGIFLILVGWACFSTLWMVSKWISNETTVPTMLFFRNVIGLVIVLPWVIMKWPKSIQLKNYKIVVFRSLIGLLNLCFIFLAVKRISLVNTTLLNNSAPFFVPFIIWLWLKKPIDHKIWPAVIVGFIGIAFILRPNMQIFNLGSLYGFLSGICLAFTTITMRMTSQKEQFFSYLFYFFFIGLIITAPFAAFDWKIANGYILLALLSIGLLSACGQFFFFHALKNGKAHQLAPFSYSSVIFSGIFEWFIWDHIPKPLAYVGIVLILAAGIWIIWTSKPPKQLPN